MSGAGTHDDQGRPAARRLVAVLAADVVGYSRLIASDEDGTLARLRALFRGRLQPVVTAERGRIFKLMGDAFLAEFPSAAGAVRCAMDLQAATAAFEPDVADERRIALRIGVHLGDVAVEGGDLLGDGVNVAARLQAIAPPGGVVVSGAVAEAVRRLLPHAFEDMGDHALKNLGRAVRVFRVGEAKARSPEATTLPELPSLVVLPFQNMSGDPEQDYFADGMVEDITTALSRIRWLFVIARNSAFTYKGRAVDVRQVGRDLGVRYVLEGSVRRAGGRLRITGQLIEAETGRHVWADRFDGDLSEVFEVQDRVAEAVVAAIEPSLRKAEIARSVRKPSEKLDAYDLYLRAMRGYYTLTRESTAEAVAWLKKALEIDPAYAIAKASLAWMYTVRHSNRYDEPGEAERAVTIARELAASGSDDPGVLRATAHAISHLLAEYDLALTLLDKALRLQPSSADVLSSLGWVYCHAGRADDGARCFERYMRLSPLDPDMPAHLSGLGIAYLMADRNQEAYRCLRRAVDEGPGWVFGHRHLIVACYKLGRLDEARQAAARLLSLVPDYRIRHNPRRFASARFQEGTVEALRFAGIPD